MQAEYFIKINIFKYFLQNKLNPNQIEIIIKK